jgi:AcrR family transcriptional regulator
MPDTCTTTPSSAPETRRADKETDILRAARTQFLTRGYAATRLDDIATEAGVAKGTLYLYFRSKEDLFQSRVRPAIVPTLANLETQAAAWQGPVADLLRRIAEFAAEVVRNDDLVAMPRLLLAEARTFPDLTRFYHREVAARGLRLLAGIIGKGVEQGEFRPVDPLVTARLLIAPFAFTAMWRGAFAPHDEEPIDPAVVAKTHIDIFLDGLRVQPRSGP